MSAQANVHRGETSLVIRRRIYILRPSFTALVAAEQELGPLFALVDRAASGQLCLREMATLFWHCLASGHGLSKEEFEAGIAECGLVACAAPLRHLLGQILQGSDANDAHNSATL